jgi:uncharacterized protein (TIGR02145 family)
LIKHFIYICKNFISMKKIFGLIIVSYILSCSKTQPNTIESFNLPSVTICNQIWTTKNLDVTTYRNGDSIPQVTDSSQWKRIKTGAWCWYNNDSATYASTYGRLYNWYAVNDSRGLAPQGWHVPKNEEIKRMVKCIDPNADTTISGYESTIAGGSLKEAGLSHWLSPNAGATNSSWFTALPSGYRTSNGSFGGIGGYGAWWSSSEIETRIAYIFDLYFDYAGVEYAIGNYKTQGYSDPNAATQPAPHYSQTENSQDNAAPMPAVLQH